MKSPQVRPRNRLASETSPYLLQHADNPVDWYPWGKEAFDRAQNEDKPVLLSIGYSACHWCHVMEHESFSNPAIAEVMNRHFICIKVDREERPDIDEVYMSAVQLMTGGGGWPLTVFLTPEGKPFFGGTYFPPEDSYGRLGFPRLLDKVAETYREKRDAIEQDSQKVVASIKKFLAVTFEKGTANAKAHIDASMLDKAVAQLMDGFDTEYGGFNPAPKFPQPGALLFLLEDDRRAENESAFAAANFTLQIMADGGIYDHLAGGFHRYSTDRFWRVPHFEKMLYDNALLVRVYTRAWQRTGNLKFAAIVRSTLDFMVADMRDPEGGFYATIDADSDGVEGAYYAWTLSQIEAALGPEASKHFSAAYGVTKQGNFENSRNVLYAARVWDELAATEEIPLPHLEEQLTQARRTLLKVRKKRLHPHVDHKIITAWNGMTISAFARAGQTLGDERYLKVARDAADFILAHPSLRSQGDKLWLPHAIMNGKAGGPAFLDDYAYFLEGLLDLYQGTFDANYLLHAERLGREMLTMFSGSDGGGLFYAAATHSSGGRLPTRVRKLLDGSVPSPVAAAWSGFLRLSGLTGNPVFVEAAAAQERILAGIVNRMPEGSRFACYVASRNLQAHLQVVVVGSLDNPHTHAILQTVREYVMINMQLLLLEPDVGGDRLRGMSAVARDKPMVNNMPTAHVCKGQTCFPPVTEISDLRTLLHNTGVGRMNND